MALYDPNNTDLNTYISSLEARISALEVENRSRKPELDFYERDTQRVTRALDRAIPKTSLLSHSFLTRAFTIWGHLFVAQLIIGGGIFVIYMVVFLVILATSAMK
jgi:hypothetical protein